MANAHLPQQALAPVAPMLKKLGFQKRHATFNLPVGDGMTHVINYQRSPYDPTRFTINLGVHVPAMNRFIKSDRAWHIESNCQLRWRIGELIEGRDTWWSVDEDDDVSESAAMLLERGLPTLSKYRTSTDILTVFERGGPGAIGRQAPAYVDFVDLYWASGRSGEAEELLAREIDRARADGTIPWMQKYLTLRGRQDLLVRLDK